MNNPATLERSAYFDIVRGCAIIFVVAIHSSSSGVQFFARGIDDPNFAFTLVVRQLLVCAVPLFVVLSGYFSPTARGDGEKPGALRSRLQRILIPYAIWSIVALVTTKAPLASGLLLIATGRTLGPHYFVPAILLLIVFDHFVLSRIKSQWVLPLCLGISTIHVLCSYVLHFAAPDTDWWYYMASPTAWLGYYGLGIYLRRHRLASRFWSYVAFAAFVASVIEAYVLTWLLGPNSGAFEPIKFTTMIFSTAICAIVVTGQNKAVNSTHLVWLGTVSYGIFLSHEIVRGRLANLIGGLLPSLVEVQPAFQMLVLAATLAAVGLVALLSQRMLGRQRSRAWLGF